MNKEYLLKSASELKQVSSSAADEYDARAEAMIGGMNALMLNRPDIIQLVGKNNMDMMKDNHANHVRFIASIIRYYNPDVLTDTVLWVFRAYRNHGFSTSYWAAQLNGWIELLKVNLSKESYSEIYPFYEWMQVNIPVFVKLSDGIVDAPNSSH